MSKIKEAEKNLPDLAAELIDNIAENLDSNDVRALHLVNSALFRKTKYAYGKRFFSDVAVFLHPTSFEKLNYIANDPCYSSTVEHIAFSTYVLRDKHGRRKGSSEEQRSKENAFVRGSAAQAIADVLSKTSNVKSVTMSDYDNGRHWISQVSNRPAVPTWGLNKLNKGIHFKTGTAYMSAAEFGDTRVSPMRLKAFEAILIGVDQAKLSSRVQVNVALEGNLPLPLSPVAQALFITALNSAVHCGVNLDAYADVDNNSGWLAMINPETLAVNYGMNFWEAKGEYFGLRFGTYKHLRALKITKAKTTALRLNNFLKAHKDTLDTLELAHVCVPWQNSTLGAAYPWLDIFDTLAQAPALCHLYFTDLAAFREDLVEPERPSYIAHQEVAWKSQDHVSRVIDLLRNYYSVLPPADTNQWVNLHYVEEMLISMGIVY